MAVIYQATNLVTSKRYLGFTKNLHRRKLSHKSAAKRGCSYPFHKAIRKYGFDTFVFDVLFEDDDAKYLLTVIEPQFIRTLMPEYNVTKGGEGVLVDSFSKEHKHNLSVHHADVRGSNNPFFGKTHSEAVRRIISEKKRGQVSPNRGRQLSIETRQKMSKSKKQYYETHTHSRLGVSHTEQTKALMRQAVRQRNPPLIRYSDGREEAVVNISEFCRVNHLDRKSFYRLIQGKTQEYKGFTRVGNT